MKYVHPELETVFDTENGFYNTLIVEEPRFLLRLLEDIRRQLEGLEGSAVLSDGNKPVSFARAAALLDSFVGFDLNRKPLLNQIAAALARRATEEAHYLQTAKLLSQAELWLDALAFGFPCDIVFPGISPAALIKAAAPEVRCETASLAERVLDYMELVETFDRPRMFFTFGLRAFIPDGDMTLFIETALSHGYHTIGIESAPRTLLPREKRIVIDADLCEIG